MLPAFSHGVIAQEGAAQPAAQQQPPPKPTTYAGDAVVIAYNVNMGKDADYEKVLATLKAALAKNPARAAQASGWKVIKAMTPQQDGTSVYIHIISPVVRDADYSIVNIVYEGSTDQEKLDFYNLYRGALKGALFQVQGPIALDLK
jgi:hypothetical protein